MNFFREFFSYNRREKRASLLLTGLIMIVIIVRIAVPEKRIPLKFYSLSDIVEAPDNDSGSACADTGLIDPNLAGYDLLVSAGLSPVQAKNVISYREAGGVFRRSEDLYRLYTIDSMTVKKIMPAIRITENNYHGKGIWEGYAGIEITDLNHADSAELAELPGIGPVLASRIIKYRNLLGGFVSVNQLNEVYGTDASIYERLSGRISADTTVVRKIYINLQNYIKHPYLTRDEANAIIELRKQGFRFNSVSDLVSEKIISVEKAEKLRHYLDFSY